MEALLGPRRTHRSGAYGLARLRPWKTAAAQRQPYDRAAKPVLSASGLREHGVATGRHMADNGSMRSGKATGVTQRAAARLGPAPTSDIDDVAIEEPLEIRVAGDPLAITMRTPGDDRELALGFLAEG